MVDPASLEMAMREAVQRLNEDIRAAMQRYGESIGVAKEMDSNGAVNALDDLEEELTRWGLNGISSNPQRAYAETMRLISLIRGLLVRVESLEKQNAEWQMLFSELKKRDAGAVPAGKSA